MIQFSYFTIPKIKYNVLTRVLSMIVEYKSGLHVSLWVKGQGSSSDDSKNLAITTYF